MRGTRMLALLVACVFTAAGCAETTANAGHAAQSMYRSNEPDYSGITFTPWDVSAASAGIAKRAVKPYTIMVYMNGSDLESESGAATYNLLQMLDSGVKAENVNLIIFTGGTLRWQNDLIPANNCAVWEVADGEIYPLAGLGLYNMGDPGTLSSFIEFSMTNFPADKFGLVLWDHGGGSIAGYGHDEKFNNGTLTLPDMGYAFHKAGLADKKLEFIGFDSCLMATVEMSVVGASYAKYLIASEDLSPGDGWDYSFLAELNNNPGMDGAQLGVVIGEHFMDYYGAYPDDILNISVIDLSAAAEVMSAMGALMSRCSDSLLADRSGTFRALARRRSGTRTFGLGSPRDNESDMVDIGDMANKLSDLYPDEASAVLKALDAAVLYNRNNSGTQLSGLSAYYIYGGRATGRESLDMYSSLNMDGGYTDYLHEFYRNLVGGVYRTNAEADIVSSDLVAWQHADAGYYIMTGMKNNAPVIEAYAQSGKHELWPSINGNPVCLSLIDSQAERSLYAAPAKLNGRDCDIIVLICESYPLGKVLGVRNEDGFIIQKGYDTVEPGDRLALYYELRYPDSNVTDGWVCTDEFTVTEPLVLEWAYNADDALYSLRYTDLRNNKTFTRMY